MNRSITQKILLVIVLVTVIYAGMMAESRTDTANPDVMQRSGPVTNSVTSAMNISLQPAPGNDCPYHRNTSHRNVPAPGRIAN